MFIYSDCLFVATAGCSQEIDSYYGINWPSVNVNTDATNNCPDGAGMNKCTTVDVKYTNIHS